LGAILRRSPAINSTNWRLITLIADRSACAVVFRIGK